MISKLRINKLADKLKKTSRQKIGNLQITTSMPILEASRRNLETEFLKLKLSLTSARKKTGKNAKISEYDIDTLLFIQCCLGCLRAMFDVLINIKKEDNYRAWANLIDAFDYLKITESYIDKYEHSREETKPGIEFLIKKCQGWENYIFTPNPVYVSPGFKETIGNCSVCNNAFETCEHIEGYIYFGKYCQRINRKIIEANHIALVKVPRDKRCILTTCHDEHGYVIDFFNRERKEKYKNPAPEDYESVFLNTKNIEL